MRLVGHFREITQAGRLMGFLGTTGRFGHGNNLSKKDERVSRADAGKRIVVLSTGCLWMIVLQTSPNVIAILRRTMLSTGSKRHQESIGDAVRDTPEYYSKSGVSFTFVIRA